MMNPPEGRRDSDTKLTRVISDVADLRYELSDVKKEMKKNTEITEQVLEVLSTFRVIGAAAKWISIVVGGIGAAYVAFKLGVNFVDHK